MSKVVFEKQLQISHGLIKIHVAFLKVILDKPFKLCYNIATMLRVYQKLENNQYIPFDNYTMLYAYELEEIAWRKFGTHMDRGIFYEYYLKDGLHPFSGLHRLDGPAYEHYYKNQLKNTSWYVKGIWLKEFESYFDKNNPGGSLLLYLKDNPRYINEIAILAKHNHWLTEEKRLLLEFAML